jgi:ABC-2 type transport system ATP-binding protein
VLHLRATDLTAFEEVTARLGAHAVRSDPQALTVDAATDGSATHVRDLLDAVDPQRRAVASFDLRATSLDDVFLALTEKESARA